ncbi:PIG-L family deacetylase [Kribbella sandramycini]|uniref:LmbE family N-acetylglucosaminyl deacetylase n=1 Tax=Kribbella sandramycini TaxID=60450 RepID=A0A7Y4L1D6_9ACTN|nr:PIG-L family deacetylase [Kribbella sandramycini]MBB6564855.1 LmbE family N-acetylglucosaminyl deacetylase [Kribbella sandramycini]NOL42553.1 PIG-L family deacetylase [Kribbella sandramycini]
MKYVCVFAHPDDEMRCLGTLLRLHAAGHELAFVTITTGDKGLPFHPPEDQARAAEIRTAEMQEVAAHFDAEYISLGREDGFVIEDADLRADLIRTLRHLNAEVLFTHWTTDYNPDHTLTAKLTTDAALLAPLSSFAPTPNPLPHTPRIWHVDPGPGHAFEPTHFVAFTPTQATRKAALIRLHRSQMDVMRTLSGGEDYADHQADHDRTTGRRLQVPHAESFRPSLTDRRIPWPSDLPPQL